MDEEKKGWSRDESSGSGPSWQYRQPDDGSSVLPLQSAWAQRPGSARMDQQGLGRSTALSSSMSVPGDGADDASFSMGRGTSIRERRINAELLETRPRTLVSKQGNDGRPVQLQANYFKMLTTTDWCLYKYRVDFSPEEESTIVRKGMFKNHKSTVGAYIFDGTVLYTSHRLPEPMELYSTRKSDEAKIQITVRFVGDMVQGDVHYLQFFNIIMRKCLEYLQLQLVGRNYFDARNQIEVRQYKLELWPGYETVIRQAERDILMCAEITHKVMRQQTLLDVLEECYRAHGENYQARFSAQVMGVTVLTGYNNNTYRIEDVDYKVSPTSTFNCKGEQVSYTDYYYNKYQIKIRQLKQPLLMSRSKSRDRRAGLSELIYLVPELCRSTGLTDEMRNDFHMMRELSNHTRLNPNGRMQRLLSFNRRLQSEPKVVQELAEWNMKLDSNLVNVPGRILDVEKIHYGNRVQTLAGDQADWTKYVKSNQMYTTTKLQNWYIIVPPRLVSESQAFVATMRSAVRQMQFPISDPEKIVLNDDRTSSYTCAIEDIMSNSNPQLIMCVVPNNRADRYSAIKKKCCVDRPVSSQCILGKNLTSKGVMPIATKVAIQLNCKIGGAPWAVSIPLKGLMIVGFDVCHDTVNKGRDYGALVASLDQAHSRYFSAVSSHTSGEELSNDLATNMCKALHKYKEENRALPSRIVVYRDGVSDGQIPYVYEHEVENLKEKLATFYGDENLVKMAYIIVTKRLSTRLFLRGGNPPPGTVIDDVITNPIKYDFFIVSQHIKQGSVAPTGYSVISDNVNLDASKIQKLTYKLTHMYYNWSGTIRVPAPCQFAHKLAFLVSQAIHAVPSSHLETLLYFL